MYKDVNCEHYFRWLNEVEWDSCALLTFQKYQCKYRANYKFARWINRLNELTSTEVHYVKFVEYKKDGEVFNTRLFLLMKNVNCRLADFYLGIWFKMGGLSISMPYDSTRGVEYYLEQYVKGYLKDIEYGPRTKDMIGNQNVVMRDILSLINPSAELALVA